MVSGTNENFAVNSPIWQGPVYAILAYGTWGLLPIYWKLFLGIPPLEVLVHRILWSVIFLMFVVLIQKKFILLVELCRSPKQLFIILTTSMLLGANWMIYIWAVNEGFVIETSLGYFINPLVNVMLGMIIFKERFKLWQTLALILALCGVLNYLFGFGELPWIALGLASSFSIYGMLRKISEAGPLIGLTMETLILVPVALLLLSWWTLDGSSHFGTMSELDLYFLGCGLITSFPLLWFAAAAKRLRFSTLGLFQYLAPTSQFLLGVFLYKEPFTITHAITFALIWMALVLYSGNSISNKLRK
ncbi:MAG: EamA family transporter RarD [SAR324 cluster bacterium]|nr:EamA family transporter RarD [SAR324 cluster bacterium]MEE1577636.1 EamA family transporter RarD [Deltaproteobacteria bacterium]MDP6247654.1 EamA family transporter RarD [SAR324 cluster bacterium]MDP6331305.1 EamA family transporter RarD [SAR324 cluster bacterium]MDP6463305.1 EamA family transporter RarD [SAR324 cluster bacterium]